MEFDLRPGGAYRALAPDEMKRAAEAMGSPSPDVIADGGVIEADPPRRLVQTWRIVMDPEIKAEGFSRLTYAMSGSTVWYRRTVAGRRAFAFMRPEGRRRGRLRQTAPAASPGGAAPTS